VTKVVTKFTVLKKRVGKTYPDDLLVPARFLSVNTIDPFLSYEAT